MTPVLDLDLKGLINVAQNSLIKDCRSIYVLPPNEAEIKKRLIARASDSEDQIKIRLERVKWDIDSAKSSGVFNIEDFVVNDDLDVAYK